ncbi:MAG TPA: DinB family protein [Rectinemataceae bacterium]|nr:DinB family protein [Rectinemataceae bacterium]
MKDALIAIAEYNRNANLRLVGILEGLSPAVLKEDQGSFYKSIQATLEHICMAEISWLRRFKGFFSYPSLAASATLASENAELKQRVGDDPKKLFALLAEVDGLLAAFAGELNEKDLESRVKYKNIKGEELERTYWHTIFHILNHSTHHRGEISALLDRKGVANDYAGFTLYTK